MNRGDEMAANIETGERQSASGAAGSDEKSDQQLHTILENIGRAAHQDELYSGFTPRLDLETLERKPNDRLGAIENQTKKRSSRGFTRYLLAICIGVAATLAWQSYGVEQLGWTKPPATPAVRSSATETQQVPLAQFPVSPSVPIAPSIDPAEVHQIAMDLAALRQTVAQITASQDQMARKVDTLQAANQQILAKMPEPPPPPPIAAAPAVSSGVTPPSENTQNTAPTSASLALRASCGPDAQRLCRGISIENGDVIKCLSSHRMELSPTCDAYFKEMPAHRTAQTKPKPVTPPSSRALVPSYIPPHP
jgi:hypothetical protein